MRSIFAILITLLLALQCQVPYEQGKVLYEVHCSNCHMDDGSGLGEAIPALNQSNVIPRGAQVACLIRNGQERDGVMVMTANATLTDTEITNIINYIRETFAEADTFIKPSDVSEVLSTCDG